MIGDIEMRNSRRYQLSLTVISTLVFAVASSVSIFVLAERGFSRQGLFPIAHNVK